MITAQEIREKTFEKAVFGGYDMATVDSFLEEVANDLTLLQKENGSLRAKMKVLVDKVEEYRRSEDALQMAILSAQKMGNQIRDGAQAEADAILADARKDAARIVDEASYESRAEKARLEEAKNVSAKFIDSMEMLCHRQLEFLQKMNELDFIRQLRETNPRTYPAEKPAEAPQPAAAPAAPRPAAPQPDGPDMEHYPPAQAAAATAQAAQPAPSPLPTQVGVAKTAAPPPLQAAPLPAVSAPQGQELHETVRNIGENVARAMDEPVVNVRPDLRPGPVVEDERPTRSFNIITDPEELIDKSHNVEP